MARSQALKLSEVRAIYRLAGDVRALGRDPAEWSRHMGDELCRLVGAKAAYTGEGYADASELRYTGFTAVGLSDDADMRGMARFSASKDVSNSRFMRAFVDHHYKRFLHSRDQLFDDSEWYRSEYYHEFRAPCGLDGWLHSQFPVRQLGGTHMICLSRPPGDRRFNDHDRRLLGLFHDELRRLWHDSAPLANQVPEVTALPPRLHDTLERLRAGDSEKQAADHLDVTRHAVHANVKRLHQWFGVNSRGELLAKVSESTYDFRPRLNGPPPGWQPPQRKAGLRSNRGPVMAGAT